MCFPLCCMKCEPKTSGVLVLKNTFAKLLLDTQFQPLNAVIFNNVSVTAGRPD